MLKDYSCVKWAFLLKLFTAVYDVAIAFIELLKTNDMHLLVTFFNIVKYFVLKISD